MIRILCTGDSHTWGQGVPGILEEFDPPVVAGDLRLASFKSNGYVNVLRRVVENITDSYSQELYAQDIANIYQVKYAKPCAVIENEGIEIIFEGSVLRLEVQLSDCIMRPEILIDQVPRDVPQLGAAQSENVYRLFTFLVEEGKHTVSIRAVEGKVLLYKVESYGGACAVMNSGVGSCPAKRYYEEFWSDHVAQVEPAIVIAEAHTINDWLTGETLEEYRQNLAELLERYKSLGAKVLLLTVSPILGHEILDENPVPYSAYVEMSRKAAVDADIKICDANTIMSLCLNGLDEKTAWTYFFDDNWHPNERGHAIYAELIRQVILPEIKNSGGNAKWKQQK